MTLLPPAIPGDPALAPVLDAIEGAGHRAYLVGGAVRNGLMGRPVDDIDIATDALPVRVMELAGRAGLRAVPTGIDHGTVTVVSAGRGFEVTTFRRDVRTDGRRAVVAFSDSLAEDARRRDFTMNALYAGRDGLVIDPVGGLPDLAAGRLRFVGTPEQRIREDYLRILRLFRFLAWYGQQADAAAIDACRALAGGLAQIARERVGAETRKLLAAPDPSAAIGLMADAGVLAHILPGADPLAITALVAHERASNLPPSWLRRLAALGAQDADEALRLSRSDARALQVLERALAGDAPLDAVAYHHGAATAIDCAMIRAARGREPGPDWRARIEHAATAGLPIGSAELRSELSGPALGRGLKAAEEKWIADGFTTPAATLIQIALLAGGASQ